MSFDEDRLDAESPRRARMDAWPENGDDRVNAVMGLRGIVLAMSQLESRNGPEDLVELAHAARFIHPDNADEGSLRA